MFEDVGITAGTLAWSQRASVNQLPQSLFTFFSAARARYKDALRRGVNVRGEGEQEEELLQYEGHSAALPPPLLTGPPDPRLSSALMTVQCNVVSS